jgi:hypothetical protein
LYPLAQLWERQQKRWKWPRGDQMFLFAPLHLLSLLIFLIPLLVLYWVIRLAVRHGNRDSKRQR